MNSVGASNSIIRLYSDLSNYASHQVRIACYEKDINFEVIECEEGSHPDIVKFNNPYNSLPTLSDRDLILYDSEVIIEYLEERFPHPPLYSVYPTVRAQTRLALLRIKKELVANMYALLDVEEKPMTDKKRAQVIKSLQQNLTAMAPIFKESPFFMSNTFGILDVYLVPLLWRLNIMDVEIKTKSCRPIIEYMKRMFMRDAFISSCTREERQFMKGIKI